MISSTAIVWWIVFLAVSAFFSGMEVAFVSSDKLRYALDKKNKGPFNYLLNTIYGHPSQFLAVLSVGNLIALILFVFSTLLIFQPLLDRYISGLPLLNYLILILIPTLIILLTGEFFPRIFFVKNPDIWVKILVVPIFFFCVLLYPITKFFTAVSRFLLGIFGHKTIISDEKILDRSDLDLYVKQSIEEMPNETDMDSEVKIFRNALDFSTLKVKDCMVPRAEIVAVSRDTDINTLKEKFIETGLSRILVYDDNIDNIIGYIHIWEMFDNPPDWTKKIASVSFVPDSMLASTLMSELMQEHKNIAVVVDEFGGTSGIVTLEDLVEEIFGDIEDEYDVESRFAKQEKENEYVVSGRMEIDQLNEMFGLDLPESEDYTTVAGLILHYTQRFPKTYETIVIGKFTFKILKASTRKIEVVRLIINKVLDN